MPSSVLIATKAAMCLTWAAFILALAALLPPAINQIALYFGVFVLVAHALEYVFVKAKFASVAGIGLVPTLLFGFAHWLPLVKARQR